VSFKHDVRELLREGGIDARVHSPQQGWVSVDGVVWIVREGGAYVVVLIDPVHEGYEPHGTYDDVRIAISEAVEHLVRYRLYGDHVAAEGHGGASWCAYEDCDLDAEVVLPDGQAMCPVHAAMALMLGFDRDDQEIVVRNLSVPDQRALKASLCARR